MFFLNQKGFQMYLELAVSEMLQLIAHKAQFGTNKEKGVVFGADFS